MEHIVAEEKCMISNEDKRTHQAAKSKTRKGGFRTMPFIIVNESFEKVASYGLMPNMILYLIGSYNMKTASASSILLMWSAISNVMAIFGAFLSDSYLGRFRVISLGSISSLLGMTILWSTAMMPQLKPPSCDQSSQVCKSATAAQLALLLSSFGLISIGAGCVRPCSIAFGADQLDNKDNPSNERLLESFFNWYYTSIGVSTVLALTIIVYIQDQLGWKFGFGVPVILMIISTLIFLAGASLYVKAKPSKSLFTGFVQVLVVAFKNRKLSLPQSNSDQYCHSHDSNFLISTDNLRCLNKACIIRDRERDLNPDGSALDSWSLCTIEKVESLKALLRVIPMWSTGIIMFLCMNQNSFSTLQAKSMDRHITKNFEIPAGSFTVFMVVTLTIWVAFYDRIMVPLLAKYTGRPQGLSTKVRMGVGLLLACAALAVAAITENIRRRIAIEEGLVDSIEEGLVDSPGAVIDMSALWLVPQFALLGLAEAFNAIGQIEFYYSQLPKSMSSIAVAIFTLGTALANLVGSLLVNIVDGVTSKDGNESWLSSNLNKGHLDYYYWLISVLGLINFIYFVACCWVYGPAENPKTRYSEDIQNDQVNYRELPSS